jgi:hypothetical protein
MLLLLHCICRVLALPGGSRRCGKSSVIESAADDLPASSAPPPPYPKSSDRASLFQEE